MSNRPKDVHSGTGRSAGARPGGRRVWLLVGVLLVMGLAAAAWVWMTPPARRSTTPSPTPARSTNLPAVSQAALPTNHVAEALMVTVELEFPGKLPTLKEALKEVERRHEPEDGHGRTFAILDAYGEPTPEGKLHMSMHVSMEKPGIGSLIFRRTGEVLWKSRIVPGTKTASGVKNLKVMMDDGSGKTLLLDGSKGATSVLDVPLNGSTALVRDIWPDGQEREFTFIYSACGCPVKAKVRRTGPTTVRTTEMPVMFPDDPAAMAVINQLMAWPGS